MSEFSPFWAEMRDMELATTRSRRKPWRFSGAWAVTSARSAGGFWRRRLTLFWVVKIAIDAVFGKTGEYPHC